MHSSIKVLHNAAIKSSSDYKKVRNKWFFKEDWMALCGTKYGSSMVLLWKTLLSTFIFKSEYVHSTLVETSKTEDKNSGHSFLKMSFSQIK